MAPHLVRTAALPSELWVHVFGYLSTTDKCNIRSCCRYFKAIVDHWSLWKGHTVVVRKHCAYTGNFWKILCRRKIKSVVLRRASLKEWKQLAISVPWLTTIKVEHCNDVKCFEILKQFHNLKRLSISGFRQGLTDTIGSLQQVTNFSVCETQLVPRTEIINAVSKLSHLTSLFYHEGNHPIPRQTFHIMLKSLPHLKYLSLKMGTHTGSLPDDYFNISKTINGPQEGQQVGQAGLTRLELLDYMDPTLSEEALKFLPSLQCLSVDYRDRDVQPTKCHLKTWLKGLPQLAVFNIANGHPISSYADSIPANVTSLTLRHVTMERKDLATVGKQIPGLLHLHYDPRSRNGSSIGEISRHFPQLRTLRIRHYNVPEREFSSLQHLKCLDRLEILDACVPTAHLMELTNKLQVLTRYRTQIVHSQNPREPTACYCTHC
ncbi:hypothetical protein UPYG_G00229990 [Umbra pygmaea]|uniref:F-box domain-containing protein n=1 Tax=Umbra pygmaea TaxID=75934 RepID=A0ABD0WD74_UMBPY